MIARTTVRTFALFIVVAAFCLASAARAECISLNGAIARFIGFDFPIVGEPTGTLYYPNGNVARSSGGTWYYQNGNTAVSSGGTWYYANGNTMKSSGGTWYYANGNTAFSSGGTLYYPNGNTAGHFSSVSFSQMVKFVGVDANDAATLIAAAALADGVQGKGALQEANFALLHGK